LSVAATDDIPEPRLCELLRAVDWRFLLSRSERPRALALGGPRRVREALPLVAEPAGKEPGGADLVVLGFPTRRRLRRARAALDLGGELVCLWRRPRIAGVQRARARLRRAGFERVSFHVAGPLPLEQPEFWLPLGAGGARDYVLARWPPRSPLEAAIRRLWRAAEASGILCPICAIAGGKAADAPGRLGDGKDAIAGPTSSLVLLTASVHSLGKVVAIPFDGDRPASAILKVARRADADASLTREEAILRELAEQRPRLGGVPAPLGVHRAAGRLAVAQTAIHGLPLSAGLNARTLPDLARRVTGRLLELAAPPHPDRDADWRRRLVAEPLDRFEERFGHRLDAAILPWARRELERLPELPAVLEHRDAGVWNLAITPAGEVAIHDWELAEPRGLPGCDLAFFLATAAFEVDGVLADGTADPGLIQASHARLLDRGTETGRVSSSNLGHYGEELAIAHRDLERLRLLGWIVQAVAGSAQVPGPTEENPLDSLRPSVLLGFIEREIRHLRVRD
jgi:hypothetical protein